LRDAEEQGHISMEEFALAMLDRLG
jgi:putative NADH-flavin reductase